MVRLLQSLSVVCFAAIIGLNVVGCGGADTGKDKMKSSADGKMMDDKMGKDKMGDDKMGKDKMGDDKMGKDKMGDDKMKGEKK